MKTYYDTVSEATKGLMERGYTTDFKLLTEDESITFDGNDKPLSANDFQIDETHRFEGDTDPGDEMIVYAISSQKHQMKGLLVNAFGLYSDPETFKIVEKLEKRK